MGPCLALLRSFEPDHPTPQQAIATAADSVEQVFADVLPDINDGQFAALIDLTIWKGADFLAASPIAAWIQGGNFALPPGALAALGSRGKAELDVWLLGNSL